MNFQTSEQYKSSSNIVENLLHQYFEHYKFQTTYYTAPF